MRRFKVDDLFPCEHLWLDQSTSHHLMRVLRLKVGTKVQVYDGKGRAANAEVAELVEGRGERNIEARVALRLTGEITEAQASPERHLLLGLTKKAAMDNAIRMATELGVTDIHPFHAGNSVPKGDATQRWERIIESAARQSGRTDTPTLHPIVKLVEALERLPEGIDARVAHPGTDVLPAPTGPSAVLIGPEGGLTHTEMFQATRSGMRPMGLGMHVLRVDTAVAAALALLQQVP